MFSDRFRLFYDVEFFGGYDVFCHFREKKGKRFMSYDVFRHFHTYFNNIEIDLISGIVFRQAVFLSFIYF